MQTTRLLLAALAGAFAGLLLAPATFAQGALTPPGAPAPMFKTLDQIESRKPLGTPNAVTTSTILISEPGSYVLVGPITVASGDGITINASNVTLDLNGFTISSTAAVGGSSAGVRIEGDGTNVDNVTIRNGFIAGSYTVAENGTGTGSGFNSGIYCFLPNPRNLRVSQVSVRGVAGLGIWLSNNSYSSKGATVVDCQTSHTGGTGIYAGNVERCSVLDVGYPYYGCIAAATVTSCYVRTSSGGPGISGVNVINSNAIAEGVGISASVVTGSYGSGEIGIQSPVVSHSEGRATAGSGALIGIDCYDGTASFCRAFAPNQAGNMSIRAGIAVACTISAGGAPIQATSKQLGTP